MYLLSKPQIMVKLALLWMCLSYDYFLYLSVQYSKIKRKLYKRKLYKRKLSAFSYADWTENT